GLRRVQVTRVAWYGYWPLSTETNVMISSHANVLPVEAAVSAATLRPSQAGRLAPQWPRFRAVSGFTLAGLLITIGVLVLLVLLFTQLLNSAATVTTLGHKQMAADSQAR